MHAQLTAWLRSRLEKNLSIDLRALALLRVAFGVLVIIDVGNRSGDAVALYSDAGWLPRASAGDPALLRAYFIDGSADYVAGVMIVTGVVAASLAVGFSSRLSSLGCWFLLGSLHQRNWLVNQGGDDVIRNMLLFMSLAPIGERWSIDRWLAGRRGRGAPPPRAFDATTIALYGQLFLIYFGAGTLKASYAHWWTGDAVYHALSADTFVTEIGQALYPHWYLLKVLTWASLALELAGPVLLVLGPPTPRFRGGLAVTFFAFHIGIAATLHVGIFSAIAAAAWLFTLPSPWMDGLDRRAGALGEARRRSALVLRVVAVLTFGYLLVSTAAEDYLDEKSATRRHALWPGDALGLKRRWALFVSPRVDRGWILVRGLRTDHREIDFVRDGAPLSWERPAHPYLAFRNQRWRKALMRFRSEKVAGWTQLYLRWLCERHGDLEQVSYVYMKRDLGPRYDDGPLIPEEVARRDCPPDRRRPREARATSAR